MEDGGGRLRYAVCGARLYEPLSAHAHVCMPRYLHMQDDDGLSTHPIISSTSHHLHIHHLHRCIMHAHCIWWPPPCMVYGGRCYTHVSGAAMFMYRALVCSCIGRCYAYESGDAMLMYRALLCSCIGLCYAHVSGAAMLMYRRAS